jgi:hypothetical protein
MEDGRNFLPLVADENLGEFLGMSGEEQRAWVRYAMVKISFAERLAESFRTDPNLGERIADEIPGRRASMLKEELVNWGVLEVAGAREAVEELGLRVR